MERMDGLGPAKKKSGGETKRKNVPPLVRIMVFLLFSFRIGVSSLLSFCLSWIVPLSSLQFRVKIIFETNPIRLKGIEFSLG